MYNQMLVNWYESGADYIGKHSDDEKALVYNSPIYSFSFLSEETQTRDVEQKGWRQVFSMPSNSLIIMGWRNAKVV